MAKKAQDAGAQIVVVSCYRDNEYGQRPNAQHLTVAPQLLADGNIDLVLGHTADVVQPLQKINGKWGRVRPGQPGRRASPTRHTQVGTRSSADGKTL